MSSEPITRENLREQAAEIAAIRVHALLQSFALPHVDEAMIEQLLKDTIANTLVDGFAKGWDSALDEARSELSGIERYRSEG